MTNQSAAEVLNDLIHVNAERIARYEKLLGHLDTDQLLLRTLFARIIGESHQNKIFLALELQAMGELIDLATTSRGMVYQHALARMDGRSDRLHVFDEAVATEDAAFVAYHISLHAEDVAAYLKDLLAEHHIRIDEARIELRRLRDGNL